MNRLSLLLACGGATGLLLAPALASPRDFTRYEDEAVGLLRASALAGRRLSYEGTQVVSSWSASGASTAVIDVAHRSGEGAMLRVAATAAGPGGTVFRPAGDDEFAPSARLLALIEANYEAVVETSERIAGRTADVVAVRRPGTATVIARFWLDRETRLALRRQVLDTSGRTLQESVFLDIDYRVPALSTTAAGVRRLPAHTGTQVGLDAIGALAADGWYLPGAMPPGLQLLDARLDRGVQGNVLHLTYADGLLTASVFQQRGRLASGSLSGWRRTKIAGQEVWAEDAYPRRVTWSSRGTVYTVVAECPDSVLAAVVAALPHGGSGGGVPARLGRGVVRVASWFNPFA